MDKIDTLLDSFKAFPTAPQILPPLLQALGEDNVNLARIVDLVSVDPALTAQILKTCNSAFFSRSTSIDSVHDAVNQLGLQTVYCIVAGTTGSQLFTSTQPANSAADWWRNAVMTAFASQFVAEGVNAEPGAMFTAGLLHDFGKVLLWQAFQADYARLLEEPGLTEPEIAKREAAAFGIDHAEVGGRLLARWIPGKRTRQPPRPNHRFP
jgi:HD-like signal output (HDOD) protein